MTAEAGREAGAGAFGRFGRLRTYPRRVWASSAWLTVAWQKISLALNEEWERGTAFLFLPVLLGGGALLYYSLPIEPALAVLPAALGVALMASFMLRERLVPFLSAAAVSALLAGMLVAQVEVLRSNTQMNGSEVATRVTGTVAKIEHLASGRIRLTIDLKSTERPRLRYAPERVRLTAREVPDGLVPEATVSGVARLMPLSGPVRPGSYDFSFHSYFDGTGAVGFFYYDPEIVAAQDDPPLRARAAARVETLRLAIAERARQRIGGPEGEIAATLLAGIRAGIPEETAEDLRRTGLAHILAISGLHMALVAATVLYGFRGVFGLMPGFSSRHPVRKYAAFGALCACAFYLVLSGGAVAAQRSFIMLAVMLVALMFDRAALTLRNLAIAAIIVIAFAPHEITGPSFQMSFAATAALIGAYAYWSERRALRSRRASMRPASPAGRVTRTIATYALGLAMTSLIAGVATTIYSAYHFNRVSPWALGANLAAMPAVTALVMPSAVLAGVAMPFGLDGPFLDLMGRGIAIVTAVARWFSERTTLDAIGSIPGNAVGVLSIALLLLTLLSSWLRAIGLPLALLGLWLVHERQLPEVLISEDGQLVAVRTEANEILTNRRRANAFTMQNWTRAMAGETHSPASPPPPGAAPSHPRPALPEDQGLWCYDDICYGRSASGIRLIHTSDPGVAASYCAHVDLIVIDDATARNTCQDAAALVLTKRDLARRGSAELWRDSSGRLRLQHAVPDPFRPWHRQRAFSREARGLPPRGNE